MRQRNIRKKYYILAIIFLGLFFYAYCFPHAKKVSKKRRTSPQPRYTEEYSNKTNAVTTKVKLKHVVVHIDLKRTPVKLSYLKQLLIILKQEGATGLLMEYEDMFPYEGELVVLRNPSYYLKTELTDFLKACKKYKLEVIPLVQTFGHMENVLHLDQFRHLREDEAHENSICPSKPESLNLIKNMLSQVISFHASVIPVKRIHIGCDEVYHINVCEHCKKRHLNNSNIYLQHINTVILMVKSISNKTNVLIWDDMLRSITFLPKKTKAEPVIWSYSIAWDVPHLNLFKYHKAFRNMWIASAYKGADGDTNVLPNIKNRFFNTYSWLNGIGLYKFAGESKVFHFKGIILTGWSRYNYSGPTVDILPASIPSLILNLMLVSKFRSGYIHDYAQGPFIYGRYLHKNFVSLLDCNIVDFDINLRESNILAHDNLILSNCNFNEWSVYNSLKEYLELYFYFTSIEYAPGKEWCVNVSDHMYDSNYTLSHVMKLYYATDFVTEYVNYLISKLVQALDVLC